jgi:glutamate dehydrogenase (NAD(P)+)
LSSLVEIRTDTPCPMTGYLAIDSLVGGAAHGGLRIALDVSPELLRSAARTMTLKYGFARLPVGGAKAAIHADPEQAPAQRVALLEAFGRAIQPFLRTGMYVPGEDMGSSPDDIRRVLRAAGVKPLAQNLMYATSGFYTGVGVCASALAAAHAVGLATPGVRVAIEGFGSVGSAVAASLHDRGASVVAVSTSRGAVYNEKGLDIPRMLQSRRELGSTVVLDRTLGESIEPESLLSLDVDILCPCAIMHSITSLNAQWVQARILCPGANVPVSDEAESTLEQQDILCIPDFVANCGGVLGSSMSRAGLSPSRVARIVSRRIETETASLIDTARLRERTLRSVASEIASARFEQMKSQYEDKNLSRACFRAAVGVYRRGFVPGVLASPIAGWYFDRRWR